jgi:ankyrin repeat protein
MAGCHAGVEDLLKAGAVVEHADKFGIRALHDAAGANDGNTIIELLLRYGAKVDVRDSEGRTAVLMASQNGMLSNTLVLLRNGADINLDAEGWTPLFSCIFWNMHDSIRLLLKEGADVTLKTHEDDSILHVAAQYADIETLIILMEVDLGSVNPQDKNIKDETASHVALSRGDEEDEWQKKFCRLVQRISDHRSKRPPLDLTGADHRPKVEALQNKSLDFEVAIYAVEKNGSESGDSMYEDAVEVHFVDHT